MNLVSQGDQNVVFNGNPSKSFFKCGYKPYANFGKQNFRIDHEGTPTLSLTSESTFSFKIKRYADLLMDTYICVTLPTIWSPVLPPQEYTGEDGEPVYSNWAPYEFRWIENLGTQIIREVSITCGTQQLQKYSGQYILSAAQRDFSANKKALFDEMTGNVPELNDPGNAGRRIDAYPNAFFTENPAGAQPSIAQRTLWIPLGAWFSLLSTQAFPLISLQNNELWITVTFRPVQQWFTIRDVRDVANNFPVIAPNFSRAEDQLFRFLQTPPNGSLTDYVNTRTNWVSDIHLNCTYCFLSNQEVSLFAKNTQKYVIRQVHEYSFPNVTGATKVDINSLGMVSSWMFYFQRSDVNLRNQWSNYTNWPYGYMPNDVQPASVAGLYPNPDPDGPEPFIGPGMNPDGSPSGLFVSGIYSPQSIRNILLSLGITLNGDFRENVLPEGVFNYVEKYVRTRGNAPDGLYCYQFCLDTNPFKVQPTGAINMNKFTKIQLEFSTITPPADPYAQVLTICDPSTGDIVGINKPTWRIYDYNFDLFVIEERLNIVTFMGGNAGLMFAT